MAISYNTPSFSSIKNYSRADNFQNWLPGIFSTGYYKGIFPIDSINGSINKEQFFPKRM